MVDLVSPHIRFHASYLDAADEFEGAPRDGDGLWIEPADEVFPGWMTTRESLSAPSEFAAFVAHRVQAAQEDAPRLASHVPCTYLWIIEDDTYLGSLAIRHRLNDFLLHTGGHIGYSVRPSARRRGIATRALQLALPISRGLGLSRVLVTCAEGNVGSRRTIEANGGVCEDTRDGVRRYWIDLGGDDTAQDNRG